MSSPAVMPTLYRGLIRCARRVDAQRPAAAAAPPVLHPRFAAAWPRAARATGRRGAAESALLTAFRNGSGGAADAFLLRRVAEGYEAGLRDAEGGGGELGELPLLPAVALLPGQRLCAVVPKSVVPALERSCELHRRMILVVRRDTHPLGTAAELTDIRPAGEGAFCTELIGRSVVRVQGRARVEAGCPVATVTREPLPPARGDGARALAQALGPLVGAWERRARRNGTRAERVLDRTLADLGPMPPAADPARRALWTAALVSSIHALDGHGEYDVPSEVLRALAKSGPQQAVEAAAQAVKVAHCLEAAASA